MDGKPPTGAWGGSLAMFKAYRAKGAPIGFAPIRRPVMRLPTPAISRSPFDACLPCGCPRNPGDPLRDLDPAKGWLAPLLSSDTAPTSAADFQGDVATSGLAAE
ncbi:MAG: hypothetical protein R3F31_06855 [Verrucomicrobiales bacterium]